MFLYETLLPIMQILLLLCEISLAAKGFTKVMYFTNAKFSCNPEYYSRYEARILPKTPGRNINIEYVISKNFTHDPVMDIHVEMMLPNTNEYRSIFKFNFDYCKFLGSNDKLGNGREMNVGNVLDIWMTNLKKYGKHPNCPVLAGFYNYRNLRADKKSLPGFIMNGKYRMTVNSYMKNVEPKIYYRNMTVNMEILLK